MLSQEIDKHKKRVLEVLLTYTFIAGIVFSIINFNRDLFAIAGIELTAGFISLLILYRVKRTIVHEKLVRLTVIYLTLFFSIMLFVFTAKGVSNSVFVWVYTIPLISYLLLGNRLGFVFTFILYSISAVIFFKHPNFQSFMSAKIAFGNIGFSALVFWGLSHIYEKANSEAKALLREMAIFDTLTGLYNRSMLNRHFLNSVDKAKKDTKKIALIILDLDFFKEINDKFGHMAGDEVLIKFSEMLKQSLPTEASAFRLGGEEFAIISLADNIDDSIKLAEVVRKQSKQEVYNFNNQSVSVTVSSGIALLSPKNLELNQLLKTADRRLYLAKSQGRNKVIFAD